MTRRTLTVAAATAHAAQKARVVILTRIVLVANARAQRVFRHPRPRSTWAATSLEHANDEAKACTGEIIRTC
jgi:hypothetical protein